MKFAQPEEAAVNLNVTTNACEVELAASGQVALRVPSVDPPFRKRSSIIIRVASAARLVNPPPADTAFPEEELYQPMTSSSSAARLPLVVTNATAALKNASAVPLASSAAVNPVELYSEIPQELIAVALSVIVTVMVSLAGAIKNHPALEDVPNVATAVLQVWLWLSAMLSVGVAP